MKAIDRSAGTGLSRFLLAVHAIAWLAEADSVCPSSVIADSVHAHASFLRRLFAPLVRSGVVEVREGRVGGYALRRPPDQITLADIYRTVSHTTNRPAAPCSVADSSACEIRSPFDRALEEIVHIGEAHFLEALSRYTIADLLRMAAAGSTE